MENNKKIQKVMLKNGDEYFIIVGEDSIRITLSVLDKDEIIENRILIEPISGNMVRIYSKGVENK